MSKNLANSSFLPQPIIDDAPEAWKQQQLKLQALWNSKEEVAPIKPTKRKRKSAPTKLFEEEPAEEEEVKKPAYNTAADNYRSVIIHIKGIRFIMKISDIFVNDNSVSLLTREDYIVFQPDVYAKLEIELADEKLKVVYLGQLIKFENIPNVILSFVRVNEEE